MDSNALLVQNLLTDNLGGDGDGIEWLVPSVHPPGPRLVNNTTAFNGTVGIYAEGYDGSRTLGRRRAARRARVPAC